MIINYHDQFKKHYRRRISPNIKLKIKFAKQIRLWQINKNHPQLNDHKLIGKKSEYRAFSITGDIRVIYRLVSENTVEFYDVGSHNQVY